MVNASIANSIGFGSPLRTASSRVGRYRRASKLSCRSYSPTESDEAGPDTPVTLDTGTCSFFAALRRHSRRHGCGAAAGGCGAAAGASELPPHMRRTSTSALCSVARRFARFCRECEAPAGQCCEARAARDAGNGPMTCRGAQKKASLQCCTSPW